MPSEDRRTRRFYEKKVEKTFIQKEKKYRSLLRASRNPEIVELEEPVFAGYKRYYVMTDRAQGSKYREYYIQLLAKHPGTQYSPTKEFKKKIGKKKIPREMEIAINYTDFREIPEPIKHLFEYRKDPNRKKYASGFYYFTRTDIFNVEIKKHYLTHRIVKDGNLESEITKLHNELYENRDNEARLSRALSRYVNYKGWRHTGRIPNLERENIREFFEVLCDFSPEYGRLE